MEKGGLSGVITVVLLVLLGFVLIGLVWVVVRNVVVDELDTAAASNARVNLIIRSTQIDSTPGDEKLLIRVRREIGKGNLTKVRILVSDSENTITLDNSTSLNELDEHTFNISYKEIGLQYIEEVSIAPVLSTESGKETIRDITNMKKFSTEEQLTFIQGGPVSWWKLDGNALDEMGGNTGTENSITYTTGQFGQAASFDGTSSYIQIQYNVNLEPGNEMTIISWANLNNPTGLQTITTLQGDDGNKHPFILRKETESPGSNDFRFHVSNGGTGYLTGGGETWITGQWYMLAGVYDTTNIRLYTDGVIGPFSQGTGTIYTNTNMNPFYIGSFNPSGAGQFFNGLIDEVMLFDKALTQEEIESIRNMDLS